MKVIFKIIIGFIASCAFLGMLLPVWYVIGSLSTQVEGDKMSVGAAAFSIFLFLVLPLLVFFIYALYSLGDSIFK